MSPDSPKLDEEMLSLRDQLLDEIEQAEVSGVASVGLGRVGNGPALMLLVTSSYKGGVPSTFKGVPVSTRVVKPAAA